MPQFRDDDGWFEYVSIGSNLAHRCALRAIALLMVQILRIAVLYVRFELTRPLKPRPRLLHSLPTITALKVIVDDAHGLHEGVDGCGADEGPAALF